MLLFMPEYVQDFLHSILERFIKKGVMDKATSMAKLAREDVNKKENLLPAKRVDIGFAPRKIINDVQAKQKMSDRQGFEFKNDCLVFLQSLATSYWKDAPCNIQL